MDPVSAFSVVVGVLQIIDYGIVTARTLVRIYKRGSTAEFERLEQQTQSLTEV